MELINLSHIESGKWQVSVLKELARQPGFTFITFESVIGRVRDTVTRIYSEGHLVYHASDNLLLISQDGESYGLSPHGVSVFIPKGTDSDQYDNLGGWDALEYWLDNTVDDTIVFQGKSFGDLLRGCKKVQDTLNRGMWVQFFKHFETHWYSAMRGETL